MQANDSTSDDLARAFSSMLNLSRAAPDMIELWRVLSDVLSAAQSENRAGDDRGKDASASSNDPVALAVRANSLLASSSMRYLLRWQQVVTRHLPRIRTDLEAFKAAGRSDRRLRDRIIDELRAYLRELAELPCDQCRALREDIESIERELLPRSRGETDPRRRFRVKL